MLLKELQDIIKDFEGTASIIVKDGDEEFLINEDVKSKAASTIKLCILWHMYKEADKHSLSLEEEIVLKDEDKVGGCGILLEFREGLSFSLREIGILMIVLSDNTATNLLIDRLGINNINKSINELGLENTILERKMYDYKARELGLENYTNPKDMILMLECILNSDRISKEYRDEMIDIMRRQQLNTKLPAMIPDDIDFAHKTGELEDIDHDVGILFLNGKTIYLAAMLKDVKNKYEAIRFHNRIGKAVYDYYVK